MTVARQRDADMFIDLDAWLRADIAGTLAYAGTIGGSRLLDTDMRGRLARTAHERRKRLHKETPRACVCGDTFLPARSNAVRVEVPGECARVEAVAEEPPVRRSQNPLALLPMFSDSRDEPNGPDDVSLPTSAPAFTYTRPVTDDQRALSTHVSMFGSDGYPVRKVGSRHGRGATAA